MQQLCQKSSLGRISVRSMRPSARRVAMAAVQSPQTPVENRSDSELETSTSSTTAQPVGKSKWVLPENEVLHSLPEHQAWTYGGMTVMLTLMYAGWSSVDGPVEGIECILSMLAAYYLADFGSGVYHWIVDNWGDGNTPVLGSQIAAFQGHHQRPWTITQRQFANNVYKIFKPATPFAAFFLVISPWTDAPFETFMATFLLLIGLAQEFHKWSHCKKSELPAAVVWAQDKGLLISRKAHGAHHKAPFDCNYTIVSGFWNPYLDRSGFFKLLEKVSHAVSGVKPRSWDLPEEWKEQENPSAPTV